MTTKINTKTLLKTAESSEDNEAYQPIAKTEQCRVGIGARLPLPAQTPTFFVEIVVNMCPACTKADLNFLERALNVLKALEQKGYMLTCQDGNSILCEKTATEQNLQGELEEAKSIVEKGLEK
jgi:hypothetical protein